MIDVCCALITGQSGEILVTQRSAVMRLPLKWEFPGGKVEPGESAEACIIREIKEELSLEIDIVGRLTACIYNDGEHSIRLIPFVCVITGGIISLAEHAASVWLKPDALEHMDWAPADIAVVDHYLKGL